MAYKTDSFLSKASGRARLSVGAARFSKVVAGSATDKILGGHMIGLRRTKALPASGFSVSIERTWPARMSPAHAAASREACLAAPAPRALHMWG